jgi:hypothetical protein
MSENASDPSFPGGPTPTRPEGPRWSIVILGGGAVLLLIAGFQIFGGREEKLAQMSASDGRIALEGAGTTVVGELDRRERPEIYYHVVLHDAPLAGRLELSCEWVDPSGRVARHNRYRTRMIYKPMWPTYCRQRFGPAVPQGSWHVRLLAGQRVLSSSPFVLR